MGREVAKTGASQRNRLAMKPLQELATTGASVRSLGTSDFKAGWHDDEA